MFVTNKNYAFSIYTSRIVAIFICLIFVRKKEKINIQHWEPYYQSYLFSKNFHNFLSLILNQNKKKKSIYLFFNLLHFPYIEGIVSTRFRIIYLYFKNSHNFVSLIKKNQYPSFSNCFSIIFPLYQRNRVINFESSTYSHNSVPLILNQNKKRNQFIYSLTQLHFPYI